MCKLLLTFWVPSSANHQRLRVFNKLTTLLNSWLNCNTRQGDPKWENIANLCCFVTKDLMVPDCGFQIVSLFLSKYVWFLKLQSHKNALNEVLICTQWCIICASWKLRIFLVQDCKFVNTSLSSNSFISKAWFYFHDL